MDRALAVKGKLGAAFLEAGDIEEEAPKQMRVPAATFAPSSSNGRETIREC